MIPYFPWTPILAEDAADTKLDLWIFHLAFEYQEELRLIVLEHLHRNVYLDTFDLSEGITTIPWKELFNTVENNLRMLVATNITPDMEPMRFWYGGVRDERFLDFADVNRWFRTMNLLIRYINTMSTRYLETGVFYVGGQPDHQAIGVG